MDDQDAGLAVEEDLDFERKEWKVERLGWALMLLVVVAAVWTSA